MKALTPYVDPPAVRRRFADELHKLASGRKFKPTERAELGRMAGLWERTLTEPDAQKK
jgi:hypothetical protein